MGNDAFLARHRGHSYLQSGGQNRRISGSAASFDWLLANVRAADFLQVIEQAAAAEPVSLEMPLQPPIESQEVWAAGVTYQISAEARERESGNSNIYLNVYDAIRPELFLKAFGPDVVGPGDGAGIRADSTWDVPEPELALVLNSHLEIIGMTIGNDMSSRSIEGANPLYLPQAKMYQSSCVLGPRIWLTPGLAEWPELAIHVRIERESKIMFEGETSTGKLHRTLADLVDHLGRAKGFPRGAILLTGTGVVPPDSFTLEAGDVVSIRIDPIGMLVNPVIRVGEKGMIEFGENVTGAQLIAGVPSIQGHEGFHSIDPRSGESSALTFANATAAEIDAAVTAAAEAWQETRAYPPGKLAGFLDAAAAALEGLGNELIEITDAETALGRPRLESELGRTTGQLRKFGALLREGSYVQAIIDKSNSVDIRRMLVPIGPVAVFAASNFPYAFAVAGGDTASAWAAGCPVVAKGHPAHPATSELIGRAISEVVSTQGFPVGFFSLVQGDNTNVGQALVEHPLITAVGFTGSLRAGRAIYDMAAARPVPIPVYAEMGSVNPLVILPGALAERAAELADGLFGSLTLGTGQFCTNPGLVFVPATEPGRAFIQSMADRMGSAEPGVLLNPQIVAGLENSVTQTLDSQAVKTLAGGSKTAGDACRFDPTVMVTTSAQLRADGDLQREHFGPVVLMVSYDGLDELVETIDTLHGQLTATIHAAPYEIETARMVYEHLRQIAGRLVWNGFPTGVAVVAAMQHGGPYPATTAPGTTSVGMAAIERFMRPVAYQSMPAELLPDALKDDNPLAILRKVNDVYTRDPLSG